MNHHGYLHSPLYRKKSYYHHLKNLLVVTSDNQENDVRIDHVFPAVYLFALFGETFVFIQVGDVWGVHNL
jgi:hypothetical protein